MIPVAARRLVTRWNAWAVQSPLRRLAHSALTVAATSLVARVLGFAKEILVAASFGLGGSLDIYLLAFVLIGLPLSILINAVQAALIAHFSRDRLATGEELGHFAAVVLLALAALAIVLPLWLWLAPHALPWLAAGFAPEKRQALETALLWLVPYYFLGAFNLLGYGVLQSQGRFWTNGLLPVATPLAFIGVLLALGGAGWEVLVIALTLGSALEALLLLFVLYRSHSGERLALPFRFHIAAVHPILLASLALLPGTAVMAISPVIDQAVAAALGEGSNAALAYGSKLPAALQGILASAIGIVALPYFARELARPAYCLHSLDKLTRWLLVGSMLLALPLAVYSAEIVALLFQRGAFDAVATARVDPVQTAYFVQLPFVVLVYLGVKAMTALGLNARLSLYVALVVPLQAALAWALGMRFGPTGIAWAAVIGSALLAVATIVTARQTLKHRSRGFAP